MVIQPKAECIWRFFDGMVPEPGNYHYDRTAPEKPVNVNIYPYETFVVGRVSFDHPSSVSLERIGARLEWKLFLSNRIPIQGKIDLSAEFKEVETKMTYGPKISS